MIRYAVNNGNWSAVGTWDGGASIPTAGDNVYANGYTVSVDQDITVTKISTEVCPTTSVSGGLFTCSAKNITANIVAGLSGCLTTNGNTTVIGDVYGGSGSVQYGITITTAGSILNLIGNAYCPTAASAIYTAFTNIQLIMVGNVHSLGSGKCVNGNSMAINITGNIYSRGGAYAVFNNSTITINGNVYAETYTAVYCTTLYFSGNATNYNGWNSFQANKLYLDPTTSIVWIVQDSMNNDINLYTDGFNDGMPIEIDVRLGTVYGIGGVFEGSAAIPPKASVALNVPVDDTVGELVTATTPADFIAALKLDALGIRLEKCATTEEVDSTVAAYNV